MSTGKDKQMKQVSKTPVYLIKQAIKVAPQLNSQPKPSLILKNKNVNIPKVANATLRNNKTIRKLTIKLPNMKRVDDGQALSVEKSKFNKEKQKSISRIKSKSNISLRAIKSGPVGRTTSSEGKLAATFSKQVPSTSFQNQSSLASEAESISLPHPPQQLLPNQVQTQSSNSSSEIFQSNVPSDHPDISVPNPVNLSSSPLLSPKSYKTQPFS